MHKCIHMTFEIYVCLIFRTFFFFFLLPVRLNLHLILIHLNTFFQLILTVTVCIYIIIIFILRISAAFSVSSFLCFFLCFAFFLLFFLPFPFFFFFIVSLYTYAYETTHRQIFDLVYTKFIYWFRHISLCHQSSLLPLSFNFVPFFLFFFLVS